MNAQALNYHYSLYKTPSFLEDMSDDSILNRVIEIVVRAGAFALSVRQLSDLGITLKGEEDFVTSVDFNNQDYLVGQLLTANLNSLFDSEGIIRLGFILEEDTQNSKKFSAKGDEEIFIYIDPIDGTTAYKDGGDDFCVGVSIERKTGENLYAVIYIPAREHIIIVDHITQQAYWYDKIGKKNVFSSVSKSQGTNLLKVAAHYNPAHREKLLEIYSFLAGRQVKWFNEVTDRTERFGENPVPGSLMIDLIDLAMGRYDLVINGGCHLWDIAGAKHVLDKTGHMLVGWDGKKIDIASFKGKDRILEIIAGAPTAIKTFFEKLEAGGLKLK